MSALSEVAPWLSCPSCYTTLELVEKRLACPLGHSFDVARQGYVNLANAKSPANADTSAMILARERFLGQGHYSPIAQSLIETCMPSHRIAEVGAGIGHYLSSVLEAWPQALGLACDVSVPACRKAARAHKRMAAVVADTWRRLPLGDGSIDTITCIFAPRNPLEFFRVLRSRGQAVIVIPDQEHLASLRESHGLLKIHPSKTDELIQSFHDFDLTTTRQISYDLELDAQAVSDLIAMGPNAFHHQAGKARPTRTKVSVQLMVFAKP